VTPLILFSYASKLAISYPICLILFAASGERLNTELISKPLTFAISADSLSKAKLIAFAVVSKPVTSPFDLNPFFN
jgi:hypothetical protein